MKTFHLKTYFTSMILTMLFSYQGLCISISTDTSENLKKSIVGIWKQKGLVYAFTDSGAVTIKRLYDGEKGEKLFKYQLFQVGDYPLVKISGDNRISYLFIDSITDSTAVLAPVTVFVRADSGKGLEGTWKTVKNFKTINLTFTSRTVTYRETLFDVSTETTSVTEERTGAYTFSTGARTGRVSIFFEDGKKTIILPILFNKFLYIFDLNPQKSSFVKAEISRNETLPVPETSQKQ